MRRLTQALQPAALTAPPAPTRRPTSSPRPAGPTPALAQPGRPLDAPVRGELEPAFGRSLADVRIHDGPAAGLAAEQLRARAFSFGTAVAFAEGTYEPSTPEGRGLLVHEIAHVLQGGAPDDAATEAEADRAVRTVAAGGRPRITRRAGHPSVHRAPLSEPPPAPVPPPAAAATTPAAGSPPAPSPDTAAAPATAPPQPATTAGPAQRLPTGLTTITDEPKGLGTSVLVVEADSFALPLEKGAGSWVQQAYDDAAAGGRLVFTPVFIGKAVAAYKEGHEDYQSIWLGRFGFPTTAALSSAFTAAAATNNKVKASLADPEVAAVVTGLKTGVSAAKCDVDHIVEKQLGGTSIPSNLQLLTSAKNQASGRETYQALVKIVSEIRDPSMRGEDVRRLQIRLRTATVPSGTPDPSFVVESHLRAGDVAGSAALAAKAAGKPVALKAGGVGETVAVADTGATPLGAMAKRIVPGMRLRTYTRGAAGASSKRDAVDGELDSRAISIVEGKKGGGGADPTVHLFADLAPAAPGAPAAAPEPAGGVGAPDPTAAAPGEARTLALDTAKNTKIAFYYPYLSPGTLTTLALDDQGRLTGAGTIRSSVPFLGTLNVVYSADELKLIAPIPAEKLVSPLAAAFRFTGGQLALQLSPELVPSGTVTFSVGPAAKPIILGDLTAKMAGGALVATGTLTPAGKIPGVSAAAGVVEWSSETGWSGRITAQTTAIPQSTADVEIGFATVGGLLAPYARGGIDTHVRGTAMHLGARWDGQGLSYSGSVVVAKPLPLVETVKLGGRFTERGLWLEGDAAIAWRGITSAMHVGYSRKEDDQEGRFSGSATIVVKTAKADGSIALSFDDEGHVWGKGTLGYQVTRTLRPVLAVELTKDQRVKVGGEVAVGNIPLSTMWPSPEGGKVSIIKGVGFKFPIPTPVPGLTAFAEIRGSLGLGYGVGPVMLKGVVFAGELYPLEDDPKINAKLKGALVVPAYGELYGTFGAYLGLEVAAGAVGAKGGVDITPRLRIAGEAGLAVDAAYGPDGFSFDAEAYAAGRLTASATVDLVADLYALYGVFSHRWTYQVAAVSADIGPEIRLRLGKIGYVKGEITWPSPSQIKAEPESIDPLAVVRDMLGRGEAKET